MDNIAGAVPKLAMFLQANKYHVTVEHDPGSALERAKHRKIDAYLLDIGLPNFDGNQLARQIRLLSQKETAKMFAIIGFGGEYNYEVSIASGFDEYVVMPANPIKLINFLKLMGKPSPLDRQNHFFISAFFKFSYSFIGS